MTEAEQHLVDVALLMAQELQEYVDVAIECAGSNSAELATQELLKDWEEAYAACGLTEEDHFHNERIYAAGKYVEIEHGEFREYIGDCDDPPAVSRSGWHYPRNNSDVESMPPPDTYAVGYYRSEQGKECGPVILKFAADVPDLAATYQSITRWHAIPEE
jgi:hypothetical protein